MGDSLRDQLLKSGIVKQVRDERRAAPPGARPKPAKTGRRDGGRRADSSEIDLAKAYAIRAQAEAAERRKAEQEAAERARVKRERRNQVQKLLEGQALNKPEADQARHFEYGGKIRRVYVDAGQLLALNAGELGVIQFSGRYILVSRAVADQVRAVDPDALALVVDPDAADSSSDGVPDDLVW
ncbi:DUF2058 domain-containing protein [Dyella ginsengisoli]|uniref:DUF2058 domain-containing protein n=1 Tax=Dyella ginsengisoli TaxID=363848 RepID=UPI00034D8004|nr:DUF2058 family protein [Dyella ginsengisoli]